MLHVSCYRVEGAASMVEGESGEAECGNYSPASPVLHVVVV